MWREAWKYGERAFRYCQLDVGHAMAALQIASRVLGWRLAEQPQVGTTTLARVLGLDRQQDFPARRHPETEREEAEVLLALSFQGAEPQNVDSLALKQAAEGAHWFGVASTIDAHPMYSWPILNDIAAATRRADDAIAPRRPSWAGADQAESTEAAPAPSAADVILGRRSARRFDSRHQMEQQAFFGLLDALTPRALAIFNVLACSNRIDFVILVHRVDDLDPGVYLLSRALDGTPSLANRLAPHFDLRLVTGAPRDLDLRIVAAVEPRPLARFARGLHCHQDVAAQSCFALAMVAEFDEPIERDSANYRTLHREAGMLGHALYLEAEARGLRGTGIGCFFDDMLHELLKLTDTQFQTLYHFAVGKPVDDRSIETTAHLPRYLAPDRPFRGVEAK
jgi:nitroreductase